MTVDGLLGLLATTAGFTDDEDVDLLTHSLQCAERLAERHPDDVELQAAGLVHDVGHAGAPDDPAHHDRVGAEMVGELLGERVAWLVRHHVVAKRYLVTTDPGYRGRLSPRSVETLALQGDAVALQHEPSLAEAPPQHGQGPAQRPTRLGGLGVGPQQGRQPTSMLPTTVPFRASTTVTAWSLSLVT